MSKTIIEKYYYIIKVVCDKRRRTYYKIGEACLNNTNRSTNLIKEYEKLRDVEATVLHIDKLPHDNKKRLTDTTIHKYINPNVLKAVDPMVIKGCIGTDDGKTEFFELADAIDDNTVINYITSVVSSLSKSVYYTARNESNTKLTYRLDQCHLVDTCLLDIIFNTFPDIYDMLYNNICSNLLFVGQFDFDFIATIAMFHNVYIWHDNDEQKHDYAFSKINNKITYLTESKELLEMNVDFDIIISNPPYGKLGAEITQTIIDNVNYKEFVNLLPANDYHRGKDDLYKYADINTLESIRGGFTDAAVTTHLTKINKIPSTITEDEFEIENYIDDSLKKYFYENRRREHYAIDIAQARPKWNDNMRNLINVNNSFIIHMRDANHGYIPNSGAATSVKWNLNRELDIDYLHENYWQNDTQSVYGFITFNTQTERDNFTNFMLGIGWAFMCKVMKAMNVDSSAPFRKYLPKVDWTRSWTVEEILADYGYNEAEIKEVMDDLVNFKGMAD